MFKVNDLVEDREGDKGVVREVDADGNITAIAWDCRLGFVTRLGEGYGSAMDFTNLSERVRELESPETVRLSFSEAVSILDVLHQAPIYALLNSGHENELGDDFKPWKWQGYEREVAQEAADAYRSLVQIMTDQQKGN